MKKLFLTMIACLALTAQAKVIKRIKSPEALLCLNIHRGELKANEVIITDTATTVKFTMTYHKGESFSIQPCACLVDEDGNRYPVRSSEGLKLGEWIVSPESTNTDFTLHFTPMPKRVKIFDFIEGDGNNMFKLIGIHDSKMKMHFPTLKELSDAYPYTVPDDWFKTDTITIKGRIEGYDEKAFGFNSMEFLNYDVLGEKDAVMVIDIKADGTFEKKFRFSSPILSSFFTAQSDNGFDEIPFFARPGETIDVTVRRNDNGGFECVYNNGSSKEVSRLLKCYDKLNGIRLYRGQNKFADFNADTEQKLKGVCLYIDKLIKEEKFTPMEVQLALTAIQSEIACITMDYAMMHEYGLKKGEEHDGEYHIVITDSVEYATLYELKSYSLLKYVDFNNPLLPSIVDKYHVLINRLRFCKYVMNKMDGDTYNDAKKQMETSYAAMRELLGSGDENTLTAQICAFDNYKSRFKLWQGNENAIKSSPVKIEDNYILNNCISSIHPLYLSAITHSYIHAKLEQLYAEKMAAKDLTWSLPKDNEAADVIRSIAARYPGRYLYIDFWRMNCGPCRSEIQEYKDKRAELAKRDDVKLIFIAGERMTEGSEEYRNYVKEWLDGEETVCVTDKMFNQLMELFSFSAIPHKEIITPDVRVVSDDISVNMYDFDRSFEAMKQKVEK